MICFPNAKINLGLHILDKRADGYHNLETIFYPILLQDALEIVPSSSKSNLNTYGIDLDSHPEDNLVMKALRLFQKHHEVPALEIHLKKKIPSGAGLGGGSSDAAFMLQLLNSYTKAGVSNEDLEKMAAVLGADCAFFVQNKPVLATGIGNQFQSIDLSLAGYTIVVVKPDVFVSTKEAYAGVKPCIPSVSLKEIAKTPLSDWKACMVNDFESSIFEKFPIIREIKEYFYSKGAIYAAMSGSGSSVFGLFESDVSISFPHFFCWKGVLS